VGGNHSPLGSQCHKKTVQARNLIFGMQIHYEGSYDRK